MSKIVTNQQRSTVRTSVTKLCGKVDLQWKQFDSVRTPVNELCLQLSKLKSYEEALSTYDSIILSSLDDDEVSAETDRCCQYSENIWDAKAKIETMQQRGQASATSPNNNNNHNRSSLDTSGDDNTRGLKLPKLNLVEFHGDPLSWQEFWDSFEHSVHLNDNIDKFTKFQHLKSLIHGDAKPVVDGYRLTAANYSVVVDVLKDRYGSPEFAIFAHFDNLLALSTASMDIKSLRTTYDEAEKHIRSLEALGLDENTFGQVFTPIILSKLPRAIRVELHRKNGSKPWKLPALRELLKDEIKARIMGEWHLEDRDAKSQSNNKSNNGQQKSSSSKPSHSNSNSNSNSSINNHSGNNQSTNQKPTAAALPQISKHIKCAFCSANHYSSDCSKFPTLVSRKAALKGACFKCLSTKHMVAACTREPKPCFSCKSPNHHSSLCPTKFGEPKSTNADPNPSKAKSSQYSSTNLNPGVESFVPKQNQAHSTSNATVGFVQMQTALVKFNQGRVSARLFFDNGSSRTYITSNLCKSLQVSSTGTEVISNARFEDTQRRTRTYNTVGIDLPCIDGSTVPIHALITDTICCAIHRIPLDIEQYPILSHINLADPLPSNEKDVMIDILVGSDFYYQIVGKERVELDENLFLLGSKVGYLTAGISQHTKDNSGSSFLAAMFSFSESTISHHQCDVEKFWTLENVGIKDDSYVKDDELALEMFNKSIRFTEGQYEVGWPWKDSNPELPDNKQLAMARLRSLCRNIQKHESVLQTYDSTIKNQLQLGIIEPVPDPNEPTKNLVHYLPHHCIVKPDRATTKLRIVYDASSTVHKSLPSLNECLLRGPVFLEDICSLLLRFRTYHIAMIADIEKAFLQVSLQPSDRDVTRFFWLKDINGSLTPENIMVYRFCRVLFGILSSPFLLSGTIKHHLLKVNTPVAAAIASNIYVDNTSNGAKSVESAKDFYTESKEIFRNGLGMTLREWQSNSTELMEFIPESDRTKEKCSKVLGIQWDAEKDTISLADPKLSNIKVVTKRQLLQAAARIYDPCGYFAPIVLQAKLIVQDTWKEKIKWDEKLPSSMLEQWNQIAYELCDIKNHCIPRIAIDASKEQPYQLHCFCDASAKAYTAMVYVKSDDPVSLPQLLMCRTKLAPIKKITICRLELMAVLLGVRLSQFVKTSLQLPISSVTIWSDSKCVLHWLKSTKVLTVFVRNRVKEIQQHEFNEYRYVPTKSNPADISSRGSSLDNLKQNGQWWHGPLFLQCSPSSWPANDVEDCQCADNKQPSSTSMVAMVSRQIQHSTPLNMDCSKYSKLSKLLRITAYCLRFISKLKTIASTKCRYPVPSETSKALTMWIQNVQASTMFPNRSDSSFRVVNNMRRQLDVFQGSNGLLRCGGRFQNIATCDEAKFPMLLPKNHPFTDLVIQDCHEKCAHLGVMHTLSEFRCMFWVANGKQQVKRVVKRCVICRKTTGSHFALPKFAPLPQYRVVSDVPFAATGIDYFGPVFISVNGQSQKSWVILFTCATTRAIHLEAVLDMSTEQLLLALRRFIAWYGVPSRLISDNAKYFKLANNVLQRVWGQVLESEHFQEFVSTKGIQWIFIPEYSPWMGGFYERLVKSVKEAMKKTLGKKTLNYVQLQTTLSEVCDVLNSRPLLSTANPDDPVLTPAHLLGRFNKSKLPAIQTTHSSTSPANQDDDYTVNASKADTLLGLWKSREQLLNQFWEVWRKFYLTSLRESSSVGFSNRGSSDIKPEPGVVVLIRSQLPRSQWQIAVIYKLHYSEDNEVRSCSLRLSTGKSVVRPLKLLYPIEVGTSKHSNTTLPENQVKSSVQSDMSANQTIVSRPPRRQAATKARNALQQQAISVSDSDESEMSN